MTARKGWPGTTSEWTPGATVGESGQREPAKGARQARLDKNWTKHKKRRPGAALVRLYD